MILREKGLAFGIASRTGGYLYMQLPTASCQPVRHLLVLPTLARKTLASDGTASPRSPHSRLVQHGTISRSQR